jgi:hypothetical protein
MLKKPEPKKSPTVWQLYVNLGPGGGGKTTIAIFDEEKKGLKFIESFEIGSEIVFYDRRHDDACYYIMEFNSKQAIDSGFLDMYKLQYLEKNDMVYALILEEIPLNQQLVRIVPEEDQ